MALRVPATRINDIANGKRGITAGHGPPPVPLLRHDLPVLDEPANCLRVGDSGGSTGEVIVRDVLPRTAA